jgi:hypothetical protein
MTVTKSYWHDSVLITCNSDIIFVINRSQTKHIQNRDTDSTNKYETGLPLSDKTLRTSTVLVYDSADPCCVT